MSLVQFELQIIRETGRQIKQTIGGLLCTRAVRPGNVVIALAPDKKKHLIMALNKQVASNTKVLCLIVTALAVVS